MLIQIHSTSPQYHKYGPYYKSDKTFIVLMVMALTVGNEVIRLGYNPDFDHIQFWAFCN